MVGVPCYVSGKGMFATDTTTQFKTHIIDILETSGQGYDTRYSHYKKQYPELSRERLARLICDPIEYYDKDWFAYYETNKGVKTKEQLTVDFFLPLDDGFRGKAQGAIMCFDEAGFGTGINCMRFIHANKPILGFFNNKLSGSLNPDNVYQLQKEYPQIVTLHLNKANSDIKQCVIHWLDNLID